MDDRSKFLAGVFAGIALSAFLLLNIIYWPRVWSKEMPQMPLEQALSLIDGGTVVKIELNQSSAELATIDGTRLSTPIDGEREREFLLIKVIDLNNANPRNAVSISETAWSTEYTLIHKLIPIMVIFTAFIVCLGASLWFFTRKLG